MIWAILSKGSSGWGHIKAELPCNKGELTVPFHWFHVSIGWQKEEVPIVKRLIKWLHDYWDGELDCPAYWRERSLEDTDDGCHLWHTFECWRCKFRFLPDFIIGRLLVYSTWRLGKYYSKEVKRLEDRGNKL